MQIDRIHLSHATTGTERILTVYRFGDTAAARPQLYIQSSLHADEVPGMLVSVHLCNRLETLEREGKLRGHIVIVPCANPIGLAQSVQGSAFGRFALSDGSNFNRHFPNLTQGAAARINGKLGKDAQANVAVVREALQQELAAQPVASELAALRSALLELALSADYVLDLHCDGEAVPHLYTTTALAHRCEPLAALLAVDSVLTADVSGDDPFDESVSRPWFELAQMYPEYPIPASCCSVTIELRGEADVSDELAARDAQAILDFAAMNGLIESTAITLPLRKHETTPFAGVLPIVSPCAGVVVFQKRVGEHVAAGEEIARIIDPMTRRAISLKSEIAGLLYARIPKRYAIAGQRIAKIAGAHAIRTGKLLSP